MVPMILRFWYFDFCRLLMYSWYLFLSNLTGTFKDFKDLRTFKMTLRTYYTTGIKVILIRIVTIFFLRDGQRTSKEQDIPDLLLLSLSNTLPKASRCPKDECDRVCTKLSSRFPFFQGLLDSLLIILGIKLKKKYEEQRSS